MFKIEDGNNHLAHGLEHLWFLIENKNPFVHECLNDFYHSHLLNINRIIPNSHVKDDRFKYWFLT